MSSDRLSRHIEYLKETLKKLNISNISSISAAVYILSAVTAIDQSDNLLNAKIKLPIIGADVTLFSFYVWSTIFLLFFHLQLITNLLALRFGAEQASYILAREYPIRSERKDLISLVSRWSMVRYFLRDQKKENHYLISDLIGALFSILILVSIFPIVILVLTVKSLPLHDNLVTNVCRLAFLIAIGASLYTGYRLVRSKRITINLFACILYSFVFIVVSMFYLTVLTFPGELLVSHENLDFIYRFDTGLIRKFRSVLYGRTYMGSRIISNIIVIRPDLNSHKSDNVSSFVNSNFVGRNLIGLNLEKVDLTKSNFSRANLTDAQFVSVKFDNTAFNNANLTNVNITKSEGKQTSFYEVNLLNALFSNNDFAYANFSGATIFDARITNSKITAADFSRSDLYKVTFRENKIIASSFIQSTIIDSDFQKMDWQLSTFDSSILLDSKFFDLYFTANSFRSSIFILNNFLVSDIRFTDFTGSINIGNAISGSNIEKINYSDKIFQPLNMSIVKNSLYRFNRKCIEIKCHSNAENFKELEKLVANALVSKCQSPGCELFSVIFNNRAEFSIDEVLDQTKKIICENKKESDIIQYFVNDKNSIKYGFISRMTPSNFSEDIFDKLRANLRDPELRKICPGNH